MRYKIITAQEIDGRRVYLDFDAPSTGYPCWLLSKPYQFHTNEDLETEINNIKNDFYLKDGYYYNSRIVVDTLEVQTIGVLDTLTIDITSQKVVDRKKALEIIDSIGMSVEDLSLVLKLAKTA